MADADLGDDDIFADLYDGEADEPAPPVKAETVKNEPGPEPIKPEPQLDSWQPEQAQEDATYQAEPEQGDFQDVKMETQDHDDDYDRPIGIKEDGKMFIGGLNWETTDQSLKDYFSQFGEVVDCQVMRDGATGRSRGFGFLTFKNPKDVNIVMVKEHFLDGKLIDPKRAIPREEQERTAKIFVGGVSQECTDSEFTEFFQRFGRVLDATLMMDKDTGRPRGFGFVTFDSEAAVDRTLEQPLSIHGKMIEVKRAQPRGNIREDDHGKFGRGQNKGGNWNNDNQQQNQQAQNAQGGGGMNNMTPAMMAQYWQKMQQYFQMMQQQIAMNNSGMNPMAANMQNMQNNPMMRQYMQQQGMNPQMMQQMMQMNQGQRPPMSPNGGNAQMDGAPRPGFNAQEQLMFEQQKYERQQNARMQFSGGGNTWDGMYDDVPAPAGVAQGGRGNFGGGGRNRGGGRNSQSGTPQPPAGQPSQAPANAPTGPKNAGPGSNYRGGGRGGRRGGGGHGGGYHPYARSGGGGGG